MITRIYNSLDAARAAHVQFIEPTITFGGSYEDAEADEVHLGRRVISGRGDGKVEWEKWGGVLQRGGPSKSIISRLNPGITTKRAPGPGPITLDEWIPTLCSRIKEVKPYCIRMERKLTTSK